MGRWLGKILARQTGNQFFASTTGGAGPGSFASPWSLAIGLTGGTGGNTIQPGDTLWIRGGTYSALEITSSLNGAAGRPITVRNYNKERVIFDGNGSSGNAVLTTTGSYTNYWGLEVTNSAASPPGGIGILVTSSNCKFINCIIHDTAASGMAPFENAQACELYGCLTYYCGMDTSLDHGVYTHDAQGDSRLIKHCIYLNDRTYGLQIYGTNAVYMDNYTLDGVIAAGSGDMNGTAPNRNMIFGGANNTVNGLVQNCCFHSLLDGSSSGTSFMCGYNFSPFPTWNGSILNNYIVDNGWIVNNTGLTMTGNTCYYDFQFLIDNGGQAGFPTNTFTTVRPTGTVIKVFPNTYESGRGHVAIYNWDGNATTSVDVSSILTVGSSYEVRNALNYFGSALLSGTYAGGSLNFPTTSLTPATPVRYSVPVKVSNEFNAYVVVTT